MFALVIVAGQRGTDGKSDSVVAFVTVGDGIDDKGKMCIMLSSTMFSNQIDFESGADVATGDAGGVLQTTVPSCAVLISVQK